MHVHNRLVTVYCRDKELDKERIVVDLKHVKEKIPCKSDRGDFNELLPLNPAAENLVYRICEQIDNCYMIDVSENRYNTATYVMDDY